MKDISTKSRTLTYLKTSGDAVLSPFKSLSCLIGIGERYEATLVGTTCQVCSKNNYCEMKQLY